MKAERIDLNIAEIGAGAATYRNTDAVEYEQSFTDTLTEKKVV